MEILADYSSIWSLIETFALLTIIFIFFKDPLRRWNFFGYRPTAIMGLLDFEEGKVLLAKKNADPWWSFSQGGIYNPDINCTVQEILKRELGLEPTRFGLRYTQSLGCIKINDPKLVKRATLSSVCITSDLKGKGYIACYIRCNLRGIEEEIKYGEGIEQVEVLSLKEARDRIVKQEEVYDGESSAHGLKKQAMVLSMMDEMDTIVKRHSKKNAEE